MNMNMYEYSDFCASCHDWLTARKQTRASDCMLKTSTSKSEVLTLRKIDRRPICMRVVLFVRCRSDVGLVAVTLWLDLSWRWGQSCRKVTLGIFFAVVGAVRGDVAARVSGAVIWLCFHHGTGRFGSFLTFTFSLNVS